MKITGLIGVGMICAAAIAVALIMTGPRAQYWKGMFGVTYPVPPTKIVQRTADGGQITYERYPSRPVKEILPKRPWYETVIGRAEKLFPMDRSQVVILLEAEGGDAPAAIAALQQKRTQLQEALEKVGKVPIDWNSRNLETRGTRDGRYGSKIELVATFNGEVDFLDLFARDELSGIGQIQASMHWLSAIDAARAEVREMALSRARARAEEMAQGGPWKVVSVDYEDWPKKLTDRWRFTSLRVSATAKVRIAGRGPHRAANAPPD